MTAILLTLLAVGRAAAVQIPEDPRGPGKPYLVAVGVGTFSDPAIQPRPTAEADAKALHALLRDPKVLGIAPERAVLLTSPEATRERIVQAIERGLNATASGDLLIVAFFGRGAAIGDKPCFLTADTRFKDRAKTALTVVDLEPVFKKIKNQKLLVLMDVSYRGFEASGEKVVEPNVGDYLKLVFEDAEREDNSLPPERTVIFGNPPFREPLTQGDHGLFYNVLAAGLTGKADEKPYHQGYEPDGLVTIQELAAYLEKEIPNAARVVGKTAKEKELQPYLLGHQSSHYWVSFHAPVQAAVQRRLEALEALVRKGEVPSSAAAEGRPLLFRMPRLKWQQELRKAYQNLVDGKARWDEVELIRKSLKASLILPREEAESYAHKVTAWVQEISSRYIKPVSPGELTAAAIRGLYNRAEEPLPADLEEALKNAKELRREQRLELLTEARLRLGRREDLEGDKAVDLSLTMASASLNDRYTTYTDRESVLRMQSQLRGRFPGVGIQIRRDAVRDGLLVATPIKGSPAHKAGIQAGDLITEIRLEVDKTGKPLKPDEPRIFSTKGMKTEEAVNLILGAPGTPVTLVVQREGHDQPLEFRINRNFVLVETVHGVQRNGNADWTFYLDERYKIAYINLSQFISVDLDDDGEEEFGTFTDLKKAINELKKQGLNGLILDLRDNPGGYLSSAVKICEMFVGKETIVTVRPRVGRTREYRGRSEGDKSFPIVVLVNRNSASASEIVAACLQDHGRATIVGERTYGKGSVQDVVPFRPTGGELKYTIARYYPPSGRNIDKLATEQDPSIKEWGVSPDDGFEVKFNPDELNNWYEYVQDLHVIPPPGKTPPRVDPSKDRQLQTALNHLRELIRAVGKAPVDR
ncbi:MAG: S41 family peptidase [Gemmataceae bacterium]|nr:S41 family peptidase [Gemmataceae bacterium]